MNEATWLAGTDITLLFGVLNERGVARRKEGRRKLRLFCAACCRQAWDMLSDRRSRSAVLTVEAFADDNVGKKELLAARQKALAAELAVNKQYGERPSGTWDLWMGRCDAAKMAVKALSEPATQAAFKVSGLLVSIGYWRALATAATAGIDYPATIPLGQQAQKEARALTCRLLREVYNPFYTEAAAQQWLPHLGTAARQLAQAAYEERTVPSGELDPARLAVLSDALEEAGCTEAAVLDHLRGPGPHYRGCWVVDLVRSVD